MKKRIIVIALLVLCLMTPVFAASYKGSADKGSVGVGLNLGTNTGVGFRYGMGKFDVLANFGLNNFKFNPFSMSADAAVSYKVYTIDGGRNLQFPITVGAGGALGLTFGEKVGIDLSVLVPVGIEYTFNEVPITLYLRLAPGVQLLKDTSFNIGFAFAGYIGALWNF
ncbi:MAG: hypothetical protein ACI4NM_04520 [Bullifex sp.]